MPRAALKTGSFTYADYCLWPEDERWELIDGEHSRWRLRRRECIRSSWLSWYARLPMRFRGAHAGSMCPPLHPTDRVLTIYRLGADGVYEKPDVQALEGQTPVGVIDALEIHWPAPETDPTPSAGD